MAGFSNSGRLATCIGVTRPNRVNLRYGSHLRLRRLRRSDYSDLTHTTLRRLHVERAYSHGKLLSSCWTSHCLAHQRHGDTEERRRRSFAIPIEGSIHHRRSTPGNRARRAASCRLRGVLGGDRARHGHSVSSRGTILLATETRSHGVQEISSCPGQAHPFAVLFGLLLVRRESQ